MSMYNLEDVNERSNAILTMAFTDEDGDPVVPDAVSYRIDDVSSSTSILAATAIALGLLAASIDVVLTAEQNRILTSTHQFETRRVTVDFTYNTDRHGTDHYQYRVVNLPGIPIS